MRMTNKSKAAGVRRFPAGIREEVVMKHCWLLWMGVMVMLAGAYPVRAAGVAGVLTDQDGKPLANVSVSAIQVSGSAGDAVTVQATVGTDSAGRYELPSLPALAPMSYRLIVAYKPGECLGWTISDVSLPNARLWLAGQPPLRASSLHSVGGKVVDSAGRPVPGATVKVSLLVAKGQGKARTLPGPVLGAINMLPSAQTDSSGRYELTGVPVGANPVVEAAKPGYAMQDPCNRQPTDTVTLTAAGRLTGRVVDKQGKPVGDAQVVIQTGGCVTGRARTDGSGHYAFSGIAPGMYDLTADAPDMLLNSVTGVTVQANQTATAPDVTEAPSVMLSGRVLDGSGNGVPGVQLAVLSYGVRGRATLPGGSTDAQGRFGLRVVPGTLILVVRDLPVGYRTDTYQYTVTVPQGGVGDFEIKVQKGEAGSGVALNASGNPAPGVMVRVVNWDSPAAQTDAGGRFRLTLPPKSATGVWVGSEDDRLILRALDADGTLGATDVATRDQLLTGSVKLTLQPVGRVDVVVRKPDGQPATGADVSLASHFTLPASSVVTTAPGRRVAADGSITLNDLVVGASYSVVASLPGYFDAQGRPLILPGSPPASPVKIVLQEANRVQQGKVMDETGAPVADAQVAVLGPGPRPLAMTQSGSDGQFTLKGLPDSRVNVTASKGNRSGTVPVTKNTGPVVIQIVPMRQ